MHTLEPRTQNNVQEVANYKNQQKFYFQKFEPNVGKIFLIGSSFVMGLNTTEIQNDLKENNKNYVVYNLGIFGDNINNRYDTTDMIIAANPTIVVYEIDESDFEDSSTTNQTPTNNLKSPFPKPSESFKYVIEPMRNYLQTHSLFPDSPKTVTWQILRKFIEKEDNNSWEPYPNTPFIRITKAQTIIANDLELKNLVSYMQPFGEINPAQQNLYLKRLLTMIHQFHDHNIKVILFVAPRHQFVRNSMPDLYKNEFQSILENLSAETGIKIYLLENKYDNLHVWYDLNHIAVNHNAIIYSQDVASAIQDSER